MFKITVITFFILYLFFDKELVQAQYIEQLTDLQKEEYDRRKLTIKLRGPVRRHSLRKPSG